MQNTIGTPVLNTPGGLSQVNTKYFTSSPVTNLHETKQDEVSLAKEREAIKAEILAEIQKENEAQKLVEKQQEEKENKLTLFEKAKRFVGTMKKAGVTVAEYTKGTVIGAAKGVLAGGIGYGACKLTSKILKNKEFSTKGKNFAAKIAKSPLTAKVLAAGIAVIALVKELWDTSLKVNDKRAAIDHKYETTHVNAAKNK